MKIVFNIYIAIKNITLKIVLNYILDLQLEQVYSRNDPLFFCRGLHKHDDPYGRDRAEIGRKDSYYDGIGC